MRHKLIDDGAGEVWRNLVTVEFARKMDWLLGERGVGRWGLIKKMRACRKHGVSGRSKLGAVPLPPLCAAPPSGWPSSPRRAEPVSQNIRS